MVCVCIQGATKSVATSSILKQLDNTHDIKRSEDLHHGNRNGTATESKKMNIQNAKSSKRWWFEGHVSVSVSLSLSRFLFVSLFFLSLCLFVSLSLSRFRGLNSGSLLKRTGRLTLSVLMFRNASGLRDMLSVCLKRWRLEGHVVDCLKRWRLEGHVVSLSETLAA